MTDWSLQEYLRNEIYAELDKVLNAWLSINRQPMKITSRFPERTYTIEFKQHSFTIRWRNNAIPEPEEYQIGGHTNNFSPEQLTEKILQEEGLLPNAVNEGRYLTPISNTPGYTAYRD